MAVAELQEATSTEVARLAEWKIDRGFLLETIICDLHSSAMQVAMLAIMIEASAKPKGAAALRSGRHMLHDDCKVMSLALHYGEEVGLSPDCIKRIDSFYRGVGEAKQKLGPMLQPSSHPGQQSDLLRNVRHSWRWLAVAAAEALAGVDALTSSQLGDPYVEDSSTLRQLLKEAADGDIRRVDAMGTIHLPLLRQRRQSPRATVKQPCMIVLPSGSYTAVIADVSRKGLGIVCSHPIEDRQSLRVALEDGRQLEAMVVRRQGDQIGLLLSTPLSAGDKLFQRSRRS